MTSERSHVRTSASPGSAVRGRRRADLRTCDPGPSTMSFVSILLMVIKRIANNINLMLAAVVGLVITVTLVSSIPLYSEGMSEALLHRQLTETTDQVQPKSSILLRHFEEACAGQAPAPARRPTSSSSSATRQLRGTSGGTNAGAGGASSVLRGDRRPRGHRERLQEDHAGRLRQGQQVHHGRRPAHPGHPPQAARHLRADGLAAPADPHGRRLAHRAGVRRLRLHRLHPGLRAARQDARRPAAEQGSRTPTATWRR